MLKSYGQSLLVLACLAAAIWGMSSQAHAQSDGDPRGTPPTTAETAETAETAPPDDDAMPDPPTLEWVLARIESLRQAEDIDEQQRARALEFFERAAASFREAIASRDRRAEFEKLTRAAPETIASIREQLAQPPQPVEIAPGPNATVDEVQRALADAEAELEAVRANAESLAKEVEQRRARNDEIPQQLATIRENLRETASELEELSPPSEANGLGPVDRATRVALLARRAELEARAASLEAELASYSARQELLPLRRDLAQRRVARTEQIVSRWREQLSRAREREAARAAREAERLRREAARQHPAIQEVATQLESLTDERAGEQGFVQRINRAQRTIDRVEGELGDLRQRFVSAQRRIEASGLNRATGLLLRRHLQTLPDRDTLRRRVQEVQRDLAEVELRLVELEELRESAGQVDAAVGQIIEQIRATDPDRATPEAEAVARELVRARRDTLAQLVVDADNLFDSLIRLDAERRELLRATEAYETFIRERILWVRSIAGGGGWMTRSSVTEAIGWYADPGSWRRAWETAWARAGQTPLATGLMVLIPLVLLATGRPCRSRALRLGALASSFRTDSFFHTLWTAGLTLVASLGLPSVLWVAGHLLERPIEQVAVAVAVGQSLKTAGLFLLPATALLEATRPGGLAEVHFRWPTDALKSLRTNIRWFLPIAVPAIVLVSASEQDEDGQTSAVIGRTAFTVLMLALALLIRRLTRPSSPVASALLRWKRSEWMERTRFLWYPLLVLSPLALLTVSWMGFHYTALVLSGRIEATIWLVLGVMGLNGILMRWLFVARRRVAIEAARRRREQQAASEEDQPVDTARTEASVTPIDESQLDLPTISAQSQQLFGAVVWIAIVLGLYLIWASVLPALRALDRVEVWPDQKIHEASTEEAAAILTTERSEPARAAAGSSAAPATGQTPPSDQPAPTQATDQPGAQPPAAQPQTPIPGAQGLAPTDPSAGGDADTSASPQHRITLADLGLALVVLVATVVAFRNIPGLVEIFVLQKLPLDAGGRYAIATVMRYLIAILGVLIAFNVIGLRWSSVQWLAAALTFGLAFGLQEIFANFVSGLIILAERPVRIGDTVTIGNVSGTVTRIRMRATTITDWDRKELVIPNKTFITGDVINWTLTSTIIRLIVPVGVSYGSDIDEVERSLLRIAKTHKLVLETPEPYVLFNSFGDSTLDFELRVFLGTLDHLLTVKHDLHNTITKTFREKSIEIAFPQRDLHVRSIGPLGDALATATTRAEALDRPTSDPGS